MGAMGAVDDSLADLPEPERGSLQRVIDTARTMVPEAVEGMSYGMPALKLDGKPLIGVVAAAKHLSVFPFSPAVIAAVAGRLEGYSLMLLYSSSARVRACSPSERALVPPPPAREQKAEGVPQPNVL